jgi:hypothetical protein
MIPIPTLIPRPSFVRRIREPARLSAIARAIDDFFGHFGAECPPNAATPLSE